MQRLAFATALDKSGLKANEIDALFAGDLLNQCVGSFYGLVNFNVNFFGIYGACSTLGEGLLLSSLTLDSEHAQICAVTCSSHNCSAERQFRFPLEYGGQRPPTAQWTVTGAASFIVQRDPHTNRALAYLTEAEAGIMLDSGVTDANNMGAAMAPAAAYTLLRYFKESGKSADDFDLILTGDLGYEGGDILRTLTVKEGYDISAVHEDCGRLVYSKERQDVHSGGSGCGCSSIVFSSYILPKLTSGEYERILLLPTGALMNPASIQQGNSILGIAHLLKIESPIITEV